MDLLLHKILMISDVFPYDLRMVKNLADVMTDSLRIRLREGMKKMIERGQVMPLRHWHHAIGTMNVQ